MNDDALLRYSRHIMLPQVGIEGQERLLKSHALIVGAGGLGSPVAMYLAAAGLGKLTLVDFDRVELSNLQRQILHDNDSIGQLKTESGQKRLSALNPETDIRTINIAMAADNAEELIADTDIVIDGCDSFESRFAINAACVKLKKPLVSGAVIRMEGQVAVFDSRDTNSPCYRCLYQEETGELDETCSETGVLASMPGIIGSIQATEALKLLMGLPNLCGYLLMLDGYSMDWRKLKLHKDPQCPVCAAA